MPTPSERSVQRYRYWYAQLLRLYPKPYKQRFQESMRQTFADVLRERSADRGGLFVSALWMFFETFASLIEERIMHNKPLVRIALVTLGILLIPLIAMRFRDEVVWDLADFVIAGGLLFGTGLTYEYLSKKGSSTAYRAAMACAVGTGLLLIWTNLAVGIIGNEENPANLMFIGVLGVGFIGTNITRFRPQGMARAMFATATAQMLVGVIALIAGMGFTLILNGIFAALWAGSGWLFRHAAETQTASS